MSGEWLTNGRRAPATSDLTVSELIVRCWKHVEVYYRHLDGRPTTEPSALKPAPDVLNKLYGKTTAGSSGRSRARTVGGR